MFRTENVSAGDLRKGDTFIGPEDVMRHDVAGLLWRVTHFERTANVHVVRIVASAEHEGIGYSQSVEFAAFRSLLVVRLAPGLQMALDAFKTFAAEAGVV